MEEKVIISKHHKRDEMPLIFVKITSVDLAGLKTPAVAEKSTAKGTIKAAHV